MAIESIKFQSKQDWLNKRMHYINSTESPALFKISPYSTEYSLYHDKKSGLIDVLQENDRLLAGQFLESGIAEFAGYKLQCDVKNLSDYYYDDAERIGTSCDYEILSGEYKGWLLECKNVDYIQFKNKWTDNEAPQHIEFQVHHQLEVTNRPGCILAALVGGNDLKLYYRPRNKQMGAIIRAKIKQFWRKFDAGIEPEPDFSKDLENIRNRNTFDNKDELMADEHLTRLIYNFIDHQKVETEAKNKKNACKAEILHLSKDHKTILFEGGKVSTGKVFRVTELSS